MRACKRGFRLAVQSFVHRIHFHRLTHSRVCAQERAQKVVQPARSEMSSRLRYYLFAFLAFVLASEVVVDLQSGELLNFLQPYGQRC